MDDELIKDKEDDEKDPFVSEYSIIDRKRVKRGGLKVFRGVM